MIGNCVYLSSGIFYALGHEYVAYEHAIYFTVGRLVWSVLICYGIIGHGLSGFGKFLKNNLTSHHNICRDSAVILLYLKRSLYKRLFGPSSFPRGGKISFLYLHVSRNHSAADNRFYQDTYIPELNTNGKYNGQYRLLNCIGNNILVFTFLLQAWRFSGDTLMAIMYAFAINVMVESPFDRLQKIIMKIFMGGKSDYQTI